MKVKKGLHIKGYIRQDSKGHYITNGPNTFIDGKKGIRLNDTLNGCKVKFTILRTWKQTSKANVS